MDGEVVHRAGNGLTMAELIQMPRHEIGFQGGRFIVVQLAPLLIGQVIVAPVIVVVADDGDIPGKPLHQVLHQSGFAAAGAPGDANDQNILVHAYPSEKSFSSSRAAMG